MESWVIGSNRAGGLLPVGMRVRALASPLVLLWLCSACGRLPSRAPSSDGVLDGPSADPRAADFSAVLPDWCVGLPRVAYAELDRVPVSSNWFEVYSVGEAVYAIYEPKQWQEVISYLIVGRERALLFDTGMGIASIRAVVSELTARPVTVLNSHTHVDHVGGNWEFERILAMDTDFTRASARGTPNEEIRGEVSPDALCAALPDGVTEDGYAIRSFVPYDLVRDGSTIALGERTVEILHVPGHTDDAIALLERETGYLWTGDTFYEGPIWLFWTGTDLASYGRATDRLAEWAPRLTRIFPAHNTPVASPERLIELRDAFRGAMDGTLEATVRDDGLWSYEFGAFSLLLQPPEKR